LSPQLPLLGVDMASTAIGQRFHRQFYGLALPGIAWQAGGVVQSESLLAQIVSIFCYAIWCRKQWLAMVILSLGNFPKAQ